MTRFLSLVISSIAVAATAFVQVDAFHQLARRQLPPCAGYGSVCRLDTTNQVNTSRNEFYTQDGDFCSCPVGTCSTVFVDDGTNRYDVYLSVATGGTSGIYICRD